MAISLVKAEDLAEIYQIEININPSPWTLNIFKEVFSKHRGIIYSQDLTLGYLFFSSIQNEAHLLNLGVREDFQRKKIGSSLMDAFINQCYAMDIQKIFLEVREANNKAINFYKKNEFKVDGIRENYYKDKKNSNAVLMSKILD